MRIQQLVTPEFTFCNVKAQSKKKLLGIIADKIHQLKPYLDSQVIYDALLSRERLGSTGIGDKVAIPHCRIPGSGEIIGMLMTLEADIDYESIDGKPVNLIFVLLAPEEANDQHLMLLNEIASLLGEQRHRDYLSASASNQNLYFRFKELGEKISAQA